MDVLIEQADQLDAASNAFLKGIRPPAPGTQPDLPALSRLAAAAAAVAVLADAADCVSGRLRAALPVAIEAEGWEECAEEIDTLFLGDAEVWWVPLGGFGWFRVALSGFGWLWAFGAVDCLWVAWGAFGRLLAAFGGFFPG